MSDASEAAERPTRTLRDLFGGVYVERRDMPEPWVPEGETPILRALRFGVLAPSAHNTQPWSFDLVSDVEARLFLDTRRVLPETDPPRRQIHMSHGTLLEVLSLAAPLLGCRAEIDLLPEGEMEPARYGAKPTASIRLVADAQAPVDPLVRALGTRRTGRLVHEPVPLTSPEIAAIIAAASMPGVRPEVHTDSATALADLAVRAMAVEAEGDETFLETLAWFRFSAEEVRARGDGLNLQTVGSDTWLARLFLTPGNFGTPPNRARFMEAFDKTLRTTQGFLTLVTPSNTMADWLTAGRAYVRGQLAAAALGLRFHPVSQALQEFPAMDALYREVHETLGVEAPSRIQMFVRVGRTSEPAVSPRRPIEAMVR